LYPAGGITPPIFFSNYFVYYPYITIY